VAVIDADAHVVEWERTWEYMDESERVFAPRVMVFKDQAQRPSRRACEYWMIGGRVFAKDGNIGLDTARETREAADVKARLAHMDELAVDNSGPLSEPISQDPDSLTPTWTRLYARVTTAGSRIFGKPARVGCAGW